MNLNSVLGSVAALLIAVGPATGFAQVDLDAEAEASEDTTAEDTTAESGDEANDGDEGVDDEAVVDAELEASVEAGDKAEGELKESSELSEIGEDALAVFELDRGFYLASDLGIFFTVGGTRGYSNVQPYLSLKGGFDIGDHISAQLQFSTGYSSGNPPTAADRPAGDPRGLQNLDATTNFGTFNIGAEIVGALRPSQRVAVEIHGGGGFSFIDPPLSSNTGVGITYDKYDGAGGHYVIGVDLKYLTLLTNFTAGVSFTHYGFIGGWGYIPALAFSANVRYTL